jgi:hypothetical protein
LATAICCYEIVVVLLALVGRSFDHWLRVAHPSRFHETAVPQILASEFSYALALFAAILLWRMRPVAAHLLAIRAGISFLSYLFILVRHPFSSTSPQPRIIGPTLLRVAIYAMGLGIVALNTFIAWYAYSITGRQTDIAERPGSFHETA